ncbi:hypothetical protein EDF60_1682 [Leucobacter luti]|uniref:hypothetical protein n=1 Tax=Leucobacter luti TaxID=340320 RepID=UPI00104DEA6F|nr:hypothetical protein [Leucobacter luti]MCW2287031.1 hypothetical protein [Leucobacter luti]TCK41256.1 hypothetical protein EDF60_1682 [Leucobacter luti]
MTENNAAENQQGPGSDGDQDKGKTFTQAELDQIITDRLTQQAKNKFGDYADLKAKAEGAKTVEQQLADLTTKHAEAEARALRSDIASTYGISKEDRDLFLTSSDESELIAQAKRLADRAADQKKNGNRAPKEGATTTSDDKNKDMREFTRGLFASAQND